MFGCNLLCEKWNFLKLQIKEEKMVQTSNDYIAGNGNFNSLYVSEVA